MTEIEKKALALWNDERAWDGLPPWLLGDVEADAGFCAICRAIEELEAEKAARAAEREQHEAFRQEVSDAITEYCGGPKYVPSEPLARFIIAKPDPIAEAWIEATGNTVGMEPLNAALAARGLKIVEEK